MAIPSVLLQLAKSSPMMGQIKQMMNTVRMAQNPQATLNSMMMNNPNYRQAMQMINQYGGDVNKALNAKMSEMGITEHDLMELMK